MDNFGEGIISSIEIEKILKMGEALADKTSLGKKRDCYPINLFTINNTIKLFHESNKETFFYFLFYSLWNEALLNAKISVKIRIYFFEIILRICIQIFGIISSRRPGRYVGYRKCEQKPFVFFLPPNKLRRIILTLIAEIICCLQNDEFIGLDRAGSHVEENHIGTIRYLSKGNNTWETVSHAEARHEFICSESDHVFYQPQPKRLNVGGVALQKVEFDIEFEVSPQVISNALISTIYENVNNAQILSVFIKQLTMIAQRAPYKTLHVPASASNATILNRLISFNFTQPLRKTNFLELEKRYVDELLLNKQAINIIELSKLFNCNTNDVQLLIHQRIEILSKRSWLYNEDNAIF